MPGLPHAGPPTPVARHPGPGHGAAGDDGSTFPRWHPSYRPGDTLQATVTVTNSGAGHYLPTYVTPKIFVQGDLLDAAGEAIADSFQEAIIGREITLNLSREGVRYPHRAKASLDFGYTMTLPDTAATLRVRIVVHPDHFYERFFKAVLRRDEGSPGRHYSRRRWRRRPRRRSPCMSAAFQCRWNDFSLSPGGREPAPA